MDNTYVLDNYALLAHFEDEAGGAKVEQLLKAAQAGKTRLFFSVSGVEECEKKRPDAQGVRRGCFGHNEPRGLP